MATGIGNEVLWWCPSLDDTGNGTISVEDFSSNTYTGTLTNMDAATDWVLDTANEGVRALDFDGTNDYVTSGFNTLTFNTSVNPLVITGWFYKRTATNGCLFSFYNAANNAGLAINTTSGNIINFTLSTINVATSNTFSLDTWNHFSVYRYNTSVIFILNGVTTTHNGLSSTFLSGFNGAFKIGARGTNTLYFNGKMDDVRVFHREISGSEQTNLASQRGYQPPSQFPQIIVI